MKHLQELAKRLQRISVYTNENFMIFPTVSVSRVMVSPIYVSISITDETNLWTNTVNAFELTEETLIDCITELENERNINPINS